MTDDELDAIEERANNPDALWSDKDDMEALVAEVRRLREEWNKSITRCGELAEALSSEREHADLMTQENKRLRAYERE